MSKVRLAIIGNGMVGHRFIEDLLDKADAEQFDITVFCEEPRKAYDRVHLSSYFSHHTAEELSLVREGFYEKHGVKVLVGERAITINRQEKVIHSSAGRTVFYDKLIMATGSYPWIPPIKGSETQDCFVYRTIEDLNAIESCARRSKRGAVVGGGLLGLEAAGALKNLGVETHVIEFAPMLMAEQLDHMGGDQLRRKIESMGVKVHTSKNTKEIVQEGTEARKTMRFADGSELEVDFIVFSTGIRPRDKLATQCGLAVAQRGGIMINDTCQTSDPDIYAIGECCEIDGQTFGLVAPCLAQADILAARLAGEVTAPFTLTDNGARLKVTGVALFSLGRATAQADDVVWSSWDPLTRHYRRLLIHQGTLAGVLLMGDCRSAATFTDLLATAAPAHADWLFDRFTTQPQVAGQNAMTKPTLVVVGHGMVGHHFLEDCVNRNLHQQYQIIVFGEERYAAYDRVHLSEYFGGRSADSLSLVAGEFFADNGIELRLSQQIVAIDRDAHVVRTASGHETHWDKLVLATGSYPFVPPVPGNDLPGCFVYRTLDDLDNIAAHAAGSRRGVVIGGGLLGLEAANALKQLGLETHVVEFAPNLMAVQLDSDGAAMLRKKIEALGVGVHTSKSTTEIATADDGLVLRFADGEQLETDMVVFSAGIRPQDALARSSGLAVGERGGICIDDGCRTSDPDVLAIGECALWEGKIFGLVAPGYQMARVAAAVLAGEEKRFTGADMSTKLKLLGVDVASFGDAHGRTPGALSYQWTHGPQQIYKKIVVSHDSKTLLGGVLVGDASEYATLVQMMLNGISLPKEPETLILPVSSGSAPKALGVAALPESAQICSCHNVSKGDICQAVSAGATDIGAI
ncbi:MAG: FAD-dependent oxidoreductase, partial [Enterobacter hormaechei]|nr:FAD-dependent oxidoreductase [Enterobacter hormaechei]